MAYFDYNDVHQNGNKKPCSHKRANCVDCGASTFFETQTATKPVDSIDIAEAFDTIRKAISGREELIRVAEERIRAGEKDRNLLALKLQEVTNKTERVKLVRVDWKSSLSVSSRCPNCGRTLQWR